MDLQSQADAQLEVTKRMSVELADLKAKNEDFVTRFQHCIDYLELIKTDRTRTKNENILCDTLLSYLRD